MYAAVAETVWNAMEDQAARAAAYAAAEQRHAQAVADAAEYRLLAAIHETVAAELANYAEMAAELFHAADHFTASLGRVRMDADTIGDVIDVQEAALRLAQMAIAARDQCRDKVARYLELAARAERDAADAARDMEQAA